MMNEAAPHVDLLVIGAGVSGLTAAVVAAHAGAKVLVLERHNVVGGCAGFYQRDGFRFDVGATVAGGFGPRGIHERLFALIGTQLAAERIDPAMVVHLPDCSVTRYGDARWNAERLRAFGPQAERFWTQQERLADLAWRFAASVPPLPRDVRSTLQLARRLKPEFLQILPSLGRSVASYLPANPRLRRFVDAQLLITAQGTAEQIDWLYGATALDLAREGTFHLPTGIGEIATALVRALRRLGGTIVYGSAAERVEPQERADFVVTAGSGRRYTAGQVISAIPLENTAVLVAPQYAEVMRRKLKAIPRGYGAAMAYVGLAPGVVPADLPSHHQIVRSYDQKLGEGESVFLSFSTPGDVRRARNGGCAVTISTHTSVPRWEAAFAAGAYEEERVKIGERLLSALEQVVPGARDHRVVTEFATPHTFERYTGRAGGYVGGAPQRPWGANLFAPDSHSGITGLALCGDSVFPGQSTVGAALSGIIAARAAVPAADAALRTL